MQKVTFFGNNRKSELNADIFRKFSHNIPSPSPPSPPTNLLRPDEQQPMLFKWHDTQSPLQPQWSRHQHGANDELGFGLGHVIAAAASRKFSTTTTPPTRHRCLAISPRVSSWPPSPPIHDLYPQYLAARKPEGPRHDMQDPPLARLRTSLSPTTARPMPRQLRHVTTTPAQHSQTLARPQHGAQHLTTAATPTRPGFAFATPAPLHSTATQAHATPTTPRHDHPGATLTSPGATLANTGATATQRATPHNHRDPSTVWLCIRHPPPHSTATPARCVRTCPDTTPLQHGKSGRHVTTLSLVAPWLTTVVLVHVFV
ncbi:hypothetical protein EDB85DRAFT_1894388 [Lactarius pseudohatsudake]|nr:hypothetical protein EDB85DRAFT_1894388 [Lactarius pseudohatsudake]